MKIGTPVISCGQLVGQTDIIYLTHFCNLNFWTHQNPRMFIVVSFIWWRFQ